MAIKAQPLSNDIAQSGSNQSSMLVAAMAQLENAFEWLELEEGVREIIRQSERELTVSIPFNVTMGESMYLPDTECNIRRHGDLVKVAFGTM